MGDLKEIIIQGKDCSRCKFDLKGKLLSVKIVNGQKIHLWQDEDSNCLFLVSSMIYSLEILTKIN